MKASGRSPKYPPNRTPVTMQKIPQIPNIRNALEVLSPRWSTRGRMKPPSARSRPYPTSANMIENRIE